MLICSPDLRHKRSTARGREGFESIGLSLGICKKSGTGKPYLANPAHTHPKNGKPVQLLGDYLE